MITSNVALFQTRQIRDGEKIATADLNISEIELMTSAAKAAFIVLQQEFPSAKKIIIYCGGGNNAGDGYVLAELAHQAGYTVIIYQYKLSVQLPPAAREAAERALSLGISCLYLDELHDNDADLIVDALLGIGIQGPVHEPMISAINQINDSGLPVLSLDVPSGLNADTGMAQGCCVRATVTITFIAGKTGMMTLDGPDYCGKILVDDLNLGTHLTRLIPAVTQLGSQLSSNLLTRRPRNCHKNDFGHVLVIGGNEGMPGSICLAAFAALRVGAGLVTIATKPKYATQGLSALPEAMIYGIEQAEQIESLINHATVCVIGPGLGTDDWAKQLFKKVIASQLPMIIDASALRLLALAPQQDDNWVLTPHPGEAAQLLNCSTQEIQSDRFTAVAQLQTCYGGNIVLKGVGSLVRTDESQTFLCAAGNPGMATAGMGDILSGIIGGLAAQGLLLRDAAKLGVWLHAHAADLAVRKNGERGLIASDLLLYLRALVND